MRKRNNIIFNLVESERDYVHQLEILVANYVRPFRMGRGVVRPPAAEPQDRADRSSGELEETTDHSRRRQFDLSEYVCVGFTSLARTRSLLTLQRDHSVPAPDLLQRLVEETGELAYVLHR